MATGLTPLTIHDRWAWKVPVQGPVLLNARQTSAAGAPQSLVIAGEALMRTTLRKLAVYASAASNATITVDTGSGVVLDLGTVALSAEAKVFDLMVTAPPGSNITVSVGAAGGVVTTTVSVVADRG